ncbi:MAG: response regulator [Candidatus Delongbacteria bacterium]|jgi:DNA-binding NtrC family response regulator|nr:response regulator [Candidatus Delongbacteria bacterium]
MLNVAVIDDDILTLRIFKDNLEHFGYPCKTFNNYVTALKEIKNYDVVILDYHLGRIKGKDIIKDIKSANENVFIIMISGYMIQNIINKDLKETLYSFHTKPVDFDKLKLELDAITISIKEASQ